MSDLRQGHPMTPQGIEGAIEEAVAAYTRAVQSRTLCSDLDLKAVIHRHLDPAVRPLVEAAEAALRYDAAIAACGNDPDRMATARTAQGDDLDALYEDWINKSRAALETWRDAPATPGEEG